MPQGGSWSGLLLGNPELGLAPAFTWTFEFRFAQVSPAHGDSPVSLTFDSTFDGIAVQATGDDIRFVEARA